MEYSIDQYQRLQAEAAVMAYRQNKTHAIEDTKFGMRITTDLSHAVVVFYPNGERQYIQ